MPQPIAREETGQVSGVSNPRLQRRVSAEQLVDVPVETARGEIVRVPKDPQWERVAPEVVGQFFAVAIPMAEEDVRVPRVIPWKRFARRIAEQAGVVPVVMARGEIARVMEVDA